MICMFIFELCILKKYKYSKELAGFDLQRIYKFPFFFFLIKEKWKTIFMVKTPWHYFDSTQNCTTVGETYIFYTSIIFLGGRKWPTQNGDKEYFPLINFSVILQLPQCLTRWSNKKDRSFFKNLLAGQLGVLTSTKERSFIEWDKARFFSYTRYIAKKIGTAVPKPETFNYELTP